MIDLLTAYDWIRLIEQVREQLAQAKSKLTANGSDPKELSWLGEAEALLDAGADERSQLLTQALELPELAEVRNIQAAELVGPWADSLEHLHAGVVFHAGLRSPLVEALFPHRKFDALRRADLEAARVYGEDFQRRLKSSYIDRLLGQGDFAFAKQGVEEVQARYLPLSPTPAAVLKDEERDALAATLRQWAERAELMIKQARLLTEAALARLDGAFTELAIRSKPKARALKLPKPTVAPVVEAQAAPAPTPAKKVTKTKRSKTPEASA